MKILGNYRESRKTDLKGGSSGNAMNARLVGTRFRADSCQMRCQDNSDNEISNVGGKS
jgi:hypothetical protein